MDILSIKTNSHSCSHLLLKIHKLGRGGHSNVKGVLGSSKNSRN